MITALKITDQNDGSVASCSLDGTVIFWQLESPNRTLRKVKVVSIPGCENGIIDMDYLTDSNSLGVLDLNRKLHFFSLDSGSVTLSIEAAYDGNLTSISYNCLRNEVAVVDEAGEIKVFSTRDGKMLYLNQQNHARPITAIRYSPDGTRLVTGDSEGKLLIWRV